MLNAANEVAVEAFLAGRIARFDRIHALNRACLDSVVPGDCGSIVGLARSGRPDPRHGPRVAMRPG